MARASLCIATGNAHKLAEIALALADLPLVLVSSNDIAQPPHVEEDGATYAANASKKALAYLAASGLPSLADDSGLEVDALDGAPGVHSHRYGGADLPFAAKIARLLAALEAASPQSRSARFRCAVALATSDGGVVVEEAACEGSILTAPRGAAGFGYDPVFYFPPLGKTFAEIASEVKLPVSHRGLALAKLRPALAALAAR
ncbi:MAG: non-canonical purine NTP pyrophosphatase [bacterium]